MPCYFPLQATFSPRDDGKKDVKFSKFDWFNVGYTPDGSLLLPCGRCRGCRVERSRQWALRCVHEAKSYEDNCFVTLTYDDDHLPADGSLDRKHVQLFMKLLRKRFEPRRIRVFYCGEYGEKLSRPHYHLCLFNFDFPDKKFLRIQNGNKYYRSTILDVLWPHGHSILGALTFESAAYVARYCTKKISGPAAVDHYKGRVPEFAGMSLKPGIGKVWLDQYGKSDVFPHDNCVVRGVTCKPPRYYDTLWERERPEEFAQAKEARRLSGEKRSADNTASRLYAKFKCAMARGNKLIRPLERL